MTIVYKGMRRMTTDVLDDYGQAHYLQNVRLKRVGEMGRRAGLGKSTMAQLAGPVQFMIGAWSNESFIVNGTGGDVTGTENPLAYWTAATIGIPPGQVGQPTGPIINFITPSPISPPATYIIGVVTFTADVTYDGLSGPLIYAWSTPTSGFTPAIVITNNANPASFNFDATCFPGSYGYTLTVSTTLHGFSTNFPTSYTVL